MLDQLNKDREEQVHHYEQQLKYQQKYLTTAETHEMRRVDTAVISAETFCQLSKSTAREIAQVAPNVQALYETVFQFHRPDQPRQASTAKDGENAS